jgi:hypothetical protein
MGARAIARTSTDATDLSQQFMSHALATFSFQGLTVAPDGSAAMSEDFIVAANEMIANNRLMPEDLGLAHHGVSVYSEAVVVQARYARSTVIQAHIILKAKTFFCPGLWPFC